MKYINENNIDNFILKVAGVKVGDRVKVYREFVGGNYDIFKVVERTVNSDNDTWKVINLVCENDDDWNNNKVGYLIGRHFEII